ncbi:MAG: tRNA (adenosine(37)-N6)-threonylcarbamoyltransferase complex dimerization subunit type 1 TsaB [Sphingomicrobium sp.]
MTKSAITSPERVPLILAFDTSTSACTAAVFAADGSLFASADEIINRGHAERLAPLISDLLDGHIPASIIVGVGPGSFTGLRIGIACAHGMAIGWNVPLYGMDSLALIAAGAPGDGDVGVAVSGGHGELFVAQYRRPGLQARAAVANLSRVEAAAMIDARLVVGNAASVLIAVRGSGEPIDMLPSAANALALPEALRSFTPSPIYARPPDATPAAVA